MQQYCEHMTPFVPTQKPENHRQGGEGTGEVPQAHLLSESPKPLC